MSVTASAVIASTFAGVDKVDAASYKVKQGDSLWSISQKYNTNVSQLIAWNNLTNSIIFPNQVIKVSTEKESKPKTETKNTQLASTASTYTIKKGDTLSKIAFAHGISLNNLMSWNNLNSTLIYPGNKLVVSKGAAVAEKPAGNNNNSNKNSNSNTNNTNASTYTIKSGDTLGKIAAAHGVSVNNLKTWNNLTSDLIFPGNKLVVSKSAASIEKPATNNNNNSSNANNNSNTNSSKANTYTIKSGDTLSKIAAAHGISVNNLMAWNNLTSHIIYVGNTLIVGENASQSNKQNSSNNGNSSSGQVSGSLIDLAQSVLGTPYVWSGATPNGFDCSGFIYWAFKNAGNDISRLSTDGYYNRSYIVNNPQVGDLVFFEGTYKTGISHMGIYLGNNQFIHAGTSTGVTITSLDNSYWNKHFHSFKRFY